MISNIRAVAFDLDGTLWDFEPVIARAERRLLDWLRENCPRMPERFSPEDMRATRERLAREEPHRAHDLGYLRKTSMMQQARACGYSDEVALQAFEVFYAARNECDVFGDVRPALDRLKTRYALGTLTNGNADLERIGLASYFSVSLNACQVGVPKPHVRCFQQLTEVLHVEPHELLYVGDDPTIDVEGARAAGLRTAWMNRKRAEWPSEIRHADLTVTDCEELVDRIVS